MALKQAEVGKPPDPAQAAEDWICEGQMEVTLVTSPSPPTRLETFGQLALSSHVPALMHTLPVIAVRQSNLYFLV